ncbi:hypothetical protein, partial [Aeromonas sp. QDB04]|uniref:hypothetical protein n=1 Tax=Aeromonas sp. QDB04 TaxID=2990477 RepID=UPI0022E95BE4
ERSHWSGNGVHVESELVFMIGRNMQLRAVEEKEVIYKAFFSDNAKDKFLGGKAISALHDVYFQKLPTRFVTERQNIHLSSHDEIALQLYLAAIELDAELDKVSVNLWCNQKEREELVHSRARSEYNYEFALLVADRPDNDPYKQRAFSVSIHQDGVDGISSAGMG